MSADRLSELLGQGLQQYFRGDLKAALASWEEALQIAPDDPRAREYVRFARQSLGGAPAGPVAVPAPVASPPAPAAPAIPRSAPMRAPTPPKGTPAAARALGTVPVSPAAPPPAVKRLVAVPPGVPAEAVPGSDSPWDEGPSARGSVDLAPPADDPMGLDMFDEPKARPAAPPPPSSPADTRRVEVAAMLKGARELFQLADFSGSLELIEKVVAMDPANAQAQEYLIKNRDTLAQMYESQIGQLDAVPRLSIPPDEIIWLSLDHRAGFVLSQIDGQSTFEDLFALSGLSRLDTARILAQLVSDGVIKPAKR